MKGLFDFFSTLEFRLAFSTSALPDKRFILFSAGDRERPNKVVELERSEFSPSRGVDQFRHLLPQSREIDCFRSRICNCLLSKLSRSRVILDHYKLLPDSSLQPHLRARLMLRLRTLGLPNQDEMRDTSSPVFPKGTYFIMFIL